MSAKCCVSATPMPIVLKPGRWTPEDRAANLFVRSRGCVAATAVPQCAEPIIGYLCVDGRICPTCYAAPANEFLATEVTALLASTTTADDAEECRYESGRCCVYCGETLGEFSEHAWWDQ